MSALPLTDDDFARLMAPLGPFEAAPHLAVAVSGGRDSLALCLLADGWARARGGQVTGITVDHGLRPGSDTEAAQAGDWLAARGIPHARLARAGPDLKTAIQAEARAARMALLETWCAENGVLHLLLGHQQDDQAETVLIRLGARSGPDGLAGMAAIGETRQVRRLRPMLGVPRTRLAATLEARGQRWIDDPSNSDRTHERTRVRAQLAAVQDGLSSSEIAAAAAELGAARTRMEASVFRLLARAATLDPSGAAWLDPAVLCDAPSPVARRALGRLVATVSGAPYAAGQEKLERLLDMIQRGKLGGGRTLQGCRIAPRKHAPRRPGLLVARELSAAAPALRLIPGETAIWDGRFLVDTPATAPTGLAVQALGNLEEKPPANTFKAPVPALARPALPAITAPDGSLFVPHLDIADGSRFREHLPRIRFAPRNSLTSAGFNVVLSRS